MTVPRTSAPRRGAAGGWPILLLVVGVAMLAVGVFIGRGMSDGRTDADADIKQVSNTTTSESENAENAQDRQAMEPGQQEPDGRPPRDRGRVDSHAGHDHADHRHATADAGDVSTVPVVFDPPELDFGTVAPGEVVSGAVQIRNIGSEPLFIEASRASCSCTAVDMSGTTIQPGESAPMEATFQKKSLGDKTAAVRLKFRGYDDVLEVMVKAKVARPVYAEPAYAYAEFDLEARQTLVHSGTFDVLSADGSTFRVLSINDQEPNFVGYNPASDEPRSAYTIAWDLSDVDDRTCLRADGEPLKQYWIIETDHPDAGMFEVQVRHLCTLPERPSGGRMWIMQPSALSLGVMKPGESMEVEALLRWLPRVPDSVREQEQVHAILSESPHVDVELIEFEKESDKADRVTMRVTISESAPPGVLYEKIRVHTGSHSAEQLLLGIVRE